MGMRPDGSMVVYIGISRSGKSVPIKVLVTMFGRVLVFDPKAEYNERMGFTVCRSQAELLRQVKKNKGGDVKLSFIPLNQKKDHEFFCALAFAFNRQAMALIVSEELAAWTNPAKAGGYWGRLINQGLALGMVLVGTVQRGQEVDKTIINNATFIHISRHSTDDDAEYIARKLGIDIKLIPRKPLEFLQWNSDKGVLCTGKINFTGSKNKTTKLQKPVFKMGKKTLTITKSAKFKEVDY